MATKKKKNHQKRKPATPTWLRVLAEPEVVASVVSGLALVAAALVAQLVWPPEN